MFWFLFFAIVGSAIAIAWLVWRRWVGPWSRIERLINQIGRGEQPPTFLVEGGHEAQRVALALENIFARHRQLHRQIAEDASGQKAILSAMQDGLLVVDRHRRIALINRAFRELFQIGDDSLGGPLLESVRNPAIEKIVADTFRVGRPNHGEIAVGAREFEMTSVPMEENNGQIEGAVVLLHDISELKRIDQIRRDFVANVSHELRTPLSILRGYIETLLDDPKMRRSESARILQVMEQHSQRLGLLANDLLTLAQLESGSSTLQLNDIDMRDFFGGLVDEWQKQLSAKELRAEVDVSADVSTIRADQTRLREIFDNLLDNAVKYSSEGGSVHLKAKQRGGEIILSVTDDGIGIAKEDLPRIFERFYRADKARSRELGGTGLGLSIVKHIAQLHGGSVEAESQPSKGTTIRVVLPVVTQT